MSNDHISLQRRNEALEIVFDALQDYRETWCQESREVYDEQWDEICEAMAHIQEIVLL